MQITYFNSKRYLSSERIQEVLGIREKHLSIHNEQKEEYEKTFQKQSIRYYFNIRDSWFEETFESMDGSTLTFYHDVMEKELFLDFMKELLSFYDYMYGGNITGAVLDKEEIQQLVIQELIQYPMFAYEDGTLIYKGQDEEEHYLFVIPQENNHYYIRFNEIESIKEEEREYLLVLLETLLG